MKSFAEGTPTATVELGGKSYELGFTVGAMKRAKELRVLNIDANDETAFMLALPEFVWSCLEGSARKELSVEQIDELMNPSNIKEIAQSVGALFRASLPEENTSGNGEPAAVKEPTAGSRTSIDSGQLVSTT